MTNKQPSLLKRFLGWMNDDESTLDRELTQRLSTPSEESLRELSPEEFDAREAREEKQREDLYLAEQEQFNRIHNWATHKGVAVLNWVYRGLALLVCSFIILFLLRTAVALPPFGAEDNPYNNEVSQRYIESGIQETGAINFVAGMILDYRAFDTFGESTVLFVAACSVIMLLKLGDHSAEHPSAAMLEAEFDDRHHEPKNDEVLQLAAKVLVPVILLFGFYIVLNGHLSPGGGFSGGAVMGAGLMLYLNAFGFEKTSRFFTYKLSRWISYLALMTYAGLKSYSFFTGANHLASGIPLGIPGAILSSGLILPLNVCVGLIVMCTMYTFYSLFRKGGM
ncbi:MAG: MnhB domain-containing protein [Eubacteriales bacterium]|nr:MnhB domain-containing protein [Eubacteriales bacterium]